jgi:hypothetical protein
MGATGFGCGAAAGAFGLAPEGLPLVIGNWVTGFAGTMTFLGSGLAFSGAVWIGPCTLYLNTNLSGGLLGRGLISLLRRIRLG